LTLRQEADKDPRSIHPEMVSREVGKLRAQDGRGAPLDDGLLLRQIEGQMRLQRTVRDLVGPVPKPSTQDVEQFCAANRQSARRPETVHVAHIVKHVDEAHSEEEARSGIEAALAELQGGTPFVEVAERHSDCKGNGGDLGCFPRGVMVEEFDRVVFAMQPGQRSPIFRTPYGFHIAELYSKEPRALMDLAELKPIIERYLMAVHERDALQRVTSVLRAKADIRQTSRSKADRLGDQ